MKKIKKILSYTVLVMALVFVSMYKVKAVTPQTQDVSHLLSNEGQIQVNNVGGEDEFAAYKILDAFYDEDTHELTYDFTSDFKKFQQGSDNDTYKNMTVDQYVKLQGGNLLQGDTASSTDLDKLATAYLAYIKTNTVSGTAMSVMGSGTTAVATATLPVGAYLIYPTSTVRVYGVMVGNVELRPNNVTDDWTIETSEITAKVDDAGVKKTIGDSGRSEGSFTVGTPFTYTLDLTVPTYPVNATNKTYTVTDKFSVGLDYAGDEKMRIYDGEDELSRDGNVFKDDGGHTVATVTKEDGNGETTGPTIKIVFDVTYVKTNALKVTYEATINDKAQIGKKNTNTASLEYSNNPYGEGTSSTTGDPNDPDVEGDNDGVADVYTYGLVVYKVSKGDSVQLHGAEFEIHKQFDCEDESIGKITVGEEGNGSFDGLGEGTYFLKETKAPVGYRLASEPFQVKVGPNEGTSDGSKGEGYYMIQIENEKGLAFFNLPGTGGIGTVIYTVVGMAIIGMAAYVIVIYRKKNKAQNQE